VLGSEHETQAFGAVLFVIYIIIGVVVAAGHHYLNHLDALKAIASAILAVLLWPLVLIGSTCTSSRGGTGRDGSIGPVRVAQRRSRHRGETLLFQRRDVG
jgi:hypothetical protein